MKRKFFVIVPLFALASSLWPPAAPGSGPFDVPITEDQQIRHALERLTFGARPGDVERIREIGLSQWIELQLHPDRIPENPALEMRLKPLESLTMSDREIVQNYPPPQYIRAVAQGRVPPPSDPEMAALVRRLAERLRERQKGETTADFGSLLEPDELDVLHHGAANEKVSLLMGMDLVQLGDVFLALPPRLRRGVFAQAPVDLRRRILLATQPQQVVSADLMEAKLYRAFYSERQLQEVLTDFWFNHFNVYMNKGPVRQFTTSYERDAIRPHALGNFGDMLLATAQHPAMLFYLDNWQSVDPEAAERIRKRRKNALQRARGLNENYARELLELHTLGVDGGYTQQDVIEVARCFTGWSIQDPRQGGGFRFHRIVHDEREKTVLGHRIPAGGGIEDGLEVIEILVAHPSTARFISMKLAQRFVADDPPPALVDRMAETFRTSRGDLHEVMRTMLTSPEFFSAGAWRAKVKSPLEMVASAVRATGAEATFAYGLALQTGQMGQPLYQKEEPTGYPNTGGAWLSSAALISRLNFAQALAVNKLPGVRTGAAVSSGGMDGIAAAILAEPAPESTRKAIEEGLPERARTPAAITALLLGSPEFQRR